MKTPAADFAPNGRPEWEDRLSTEQKRPDALGHLSRILPEGVALKPLFTAADCPNLEVPVRSPGFLIQQVLSADADGMWRKRWQVARTGGAEALHLTISQVPSDWDAIEAIAAEVPLTLDIDTPAGVPSSLQACCLMHPACQGLDDALNGPTGILPASSIAHWGGSAVAELALMLYAQALNVGTTTVEVSLGRHFLTDVAKLRAARLLLPHVTLRAIVSPWNLARTEAETNLLRCTTAAMAGIIGGASVIGIPPHDQTTSPEDADRWARGILLLLRHESHLDAVADPAAGSHALEWLTAQLIAEARQLFDSMNQNNNPALVLRERIQQDAAQRAEALASGQEVLLGVNRFVPKGKDPLQAEAVQHRFRADQLSRWSAAAEAAQAANRT